MEYLFWLLTALIAYLFGSIPTAVWVGKRFYGIDVRTQGSKNAGATNTFRVLGKKAGIIVLAVDSIKGLAASTAPLILQSTGFFTTHNLIELQIMAGMMAIVGHIFPLFAGFKGGKGVATAAGMMLGIHPQGVGLCVGIFLVVLILTGYVSVGSMIAAISFPILLKMRVFGDYNMTLLVLGVFIAVGIVYTHKKNISRLMRGEESKTYLWGGGKARQSHT